MKKVFLEFFQNSQENNCARVSFLRKLQEAASRFILILTIFRLDVSQKLKKWVSKKIDKPGAATQNRSPKFVKIFLTI